MKNLKYFLLGSMMLSSAILGCKKDNYLTEKEGFKGLAIISGTTEEATIDYTISREGKEYLIIEGDGYLLKAENNDDNPDIDYLEVIKLNSQIIEKGEIERSAFNLKYDRNTFPNPLQAEEIMESTERITKEMRKFVKENLSSYKRPIVKSNPLEELTKKNFILY